MSTKKTCRRKLFEPLRLQLSEQTGLAGTEIFGELAEQLASFAREGASTSESKISQLKQQLLAVIQAGGKLEAHLQDRHYIRAALALWRESETFYQLAPPSKTALQHIQQQLPQPSRVLLWQFIQLYFERFDQLPAPRGLADFILHSLNKLPERETESQDIRQYRQYSAILFAKDAAELIAAQAEKSQHTLPEMLKSRAVPAASRFSEACYQARYLQPLEALKPGANHPLFAELQQEHIKTVPFSDGLYLGHHIARLLMSKVMRHAGDLPENWRYLLISIMGDPRVPRAAPSFQQWWGRLEGRYVKAMRTWLSQLDLKLFLNILEEVARSHDREDLLRMYPARKRFLEGLHAQGLITGSRLLLGSQAEKYIRENFDERDVLEFGRLGSSDASLIYLNISGIHLIEGTHAFQARIYQELSIEGLDDYEVQHFKLATIRKAHADASIKHSHSSVPRWQHSLIQTLANPPFKLAIDPSWVLSKEDYAAYSDAFLNPVPRKPLKTVVAPKKTTTRRKRITPKKT